MPPPPGRPVTARRGPMSYLLWLVPIALGMGVVGLAAFLWSLRDGQYRDLDGAAVRVLTAEAQDRPLADRADAFPGEVVRCPETRQDDKLKPRRGGKHGTGRR